MIAITTNSSIKVNPRGERAEEISPLVLIFFIWMLVFFLPQVGQDHSQPGIIALYDITD